MKTVEKKSRILIVSGGSIEDAFVLDLLEKNSYETVIACDSGMEFFHRNSLYPDLILGDFDSTDRTTVDYFKEQTEVRLEQFPAQKDWTDTELAVRRALELRPDHLDLVGATGSRLDHVFANVGLLCQTIERGIDMQIVDETDADETDALLAEMHGAPRTVELEGLH